VGIKSKVISAILVFQLAPKRPNKPYFLKNVEMLSLVDISVIFTEES